MSQAVTRAYARTKEQESALKEYGVPARDIYLQGRGVEDLESCLETFRGRPGRLLLASDVTAFCPGDQPSKAVVSATMTRLERAKVRVTDIIHPQDDTVSAQNRRADIRISNSRFRDRRTARRRGRKGGQRKGEIAALQRQAIAAEWVIWNVVNDPAISWAKAVRVFGGKISESTMRRQYWRKPRPKMRRRA